MNQKKRSLVTLAGLSAVAAGAGLFAYYGVHRRQEREAAAKEKSEKLFPDFDKAKVKGLRVTAKGAITALQPRAGGGGWDIVSPVQAPADQGAVDALLDRLGTVRSKLTVEQKSADLARFGLDKPVIQIAVQREGAPDLALRVGADNEFDGSTYVALGEGSDVLQSDGGLKAAFDKDPFDLRDKRLLTFEDGKVEGLEVRVDQNRFALKRQAGKWALTSPVAERADESAVSRILSALRDLRATRIAAESASDEDLNKAGLDKPKAEVALSLEGGAKMTLAAAQVAGKSFARRGDSKLVAEVPGSLFTDLSPKLLDLRDKTVIAFERDQVQAIRFALGGEPVELERVKGAPDAGAADAWRMTAPTAGAARQAKVNSLLWSLGSLKAVAFDDDSPADLGKYGLDKPTRWVTLLGEGGKELDTLQIGKDVNSNVYVRSGAGKRVLEVEKSRIAELPKGKADLEEVAAPPDAGAPQAAK